jgi:hypothetical protein
MGYPEALTRLDRLEARRKSLELEVAAVRTELYDAPLRVLWLLPTMLRRKRELRAVLTALALLRGRLGH